MLTVVAAAPPPPVFSQQLPALCQYLAPVCCQLRVAGGRDHRHSLQQGWVVGEGWIRMSYSA